MFRRPDRRPNIYEGGLYTCILRNVEPRSSQKMHSQSIYLSFVKIKLYLSEFVFVLLYFKIFDGTYITWCQPACVLQRVQSYPLYKLFSSDKPLLIVPLWGGGDKKLIDKLFLSFRFRYGQHDMKKIWNWSLDKNVAKTFCLIKPNFTGWKELARQNDLKAGESFKLNMIRSLK